MVPEDPEAEDPETEVSGAELDSTLSDEFAIPAGFEDADTETLVERAHAGEVDALNELFARYHGLMVDLARRKLGPRLRLKEDPDDLAQTTFREATRDFERYRYQGPDSLLRWLRQILHNKIRDRAEFYSAGKRDTSMETHLDSETNFGSGGSSRQDIPATDLSVTRVVARDERFSRLRIALEELRPEYRQAITLVFFQQLPLREAGKRMGGRSEDAVRMMLRRAEARLGDMLKGHIGPDMEDSTFG